MKLMIKLRRSTTLQLTVLPLANNVMAGMRWVIGFTPLQIDAVYATCCVYDWRVSTGIPMSSMQLMIKADVLFITDESHRVQCCAAISPAEFLRVPLSSRVSKVFEFFCKQYAFV
jgi:hypothetical protein